jgi:hypothetical protein
MSEDSSSALAGYSVELHFTRIIQRRVAGEVLVPSAVLAEAVEDGRSRYGDELTAPLEGETVDTTLIEAIASATTGGSRRSHSSRCAASGCPDRRGTDAQRRRVTEKAALKAAMHSKSSAARAIALGDARAHPEIVSLKGVTPNLTASLSRNEQFQAIRVAELIVPKLGDKDLRRLRRMLVSAQYVKDDEDRRSLRVVGVAEIDARLEDGSLSPAHP